MEVYVMKIKQTYLIEKTEVDYRPNQKKINRYDTTEMQVLCADGALMSINKEEARLIFSAAS